MCNTLSIFFSRSTSFDPIDGVFTILYIICNNSAIWRVARKKGCAEGAAPSATLFSRKSVSSLSRYKYVHKRRVAMNRQTISGVIVRFFGLVVAIELVVLIIILILGWRMGWSSMDQYSEGLQIAGMLIIGLGLFGIKGNWESMRSFEYQYSMSASEQSSLQRTQQTLSDIAESYRFMLLMFFVGGICIIIGWLLSP